MSKQQPSTSRKPATRKKPQRKKPQARKQPPPPGHPITLGGTTYTMRTPGHQAIQAFEAFVLEHRMSPLDIAKTKLDGLSPEQQRALLRDALAQESSMPTAISESDFATALDTREGAALMFWLMIRENHPDVSKEQVEGIIEQATDDEFQRLLDERDKMAV